MYLYLLYLLNLQEGRGEQVLRRRRRPLADNHNDHDGRQPRQGSGARRVQETGERELTDSVTTV